MVGSQLSWFSLHAFAIVAVTALFTGTVIALYIFNSLAACAAVLSVDGAAAYFLAAELAPAPIPPMVEWLEPGNQHARRALFKVNEAFPFDEVRPVH